MSGTAGLTFYQALTAAVADMTANGLDNVQRLAYWTQIIREAAVRSLTPDYVVEEQMNRFFNATYQKLISKGQILKRHPGVSRFTLEQLKPHLYAEMDRRRQTAVNLIKLDRQKMIMDVEQRFTGWGSSVPAGGSDAIDVNDVKAGIKKPLRSLKFTERRVHIDQGHKFAANLSDIVAQNAGAIAAIWHSHWRQNHYNYRKDHRARDEQIYIIRGNWAIERKLMRTAGNLYTDEITMPGEEVYCRCFYEYIYSLQDLPDDLLTQFGRDELRRAKALIAA